MTDKKTARDVLEGMYVTVTPNIKLDITQALHSLRALIDEGRGEKLPLDVIVGGGSPYSYNNCHDKTTEALDDLGIK